MQTTTVGLKTRRTLNRQRTMEYELHNGRGYQSHYGARLHFGLGGSSNVDRIEIAWVDGDLQVVEQLAADQILTIVQP
ncbi:MAG: ASPIC/UnbV domain-containing protein [Aureliella sp.]